MAAPKTPAQNLSNLTSENVSPAPELRAVALPERLRQIDPAGADKWAADQQRIFTDWVKGINTLNAQQVAVLKK